MSTRWYPLYQRGNPQLRIFLPNFFMKLVKMTAYEYPENVVHFKCSLRMTDIDIKNYLEKIYEIPTVEVKSKIVAGNIKRSPGRGYIVKDDDFRLARVVLAKTEKFTYPDLFPEIKDDAQDDKKALDENKKKFGEYLDRNRLRPGVPNWFSI